MSGLIGRILSMGNDFLLVLAIAVFVSAVFTWIGAHLAGALQTTLARAFWAAVAGMMVVWLVGSLFSAFIPVVGPIFGLLPGFFLVLFVIQLIFETSFFRAVLVWVFFVLGQLAAGRLSGFLFLNRPKAFIWWGPEF
jgi:hypothetical protein